MATATATAVSSAECRKAFYQLPHSLRNFFLRFPPTQLHKQIRPKDPRWTRQPESSLSAVSETEPTSIADPTSRPPPRPTFDPDPTPYKSPFEPSMVLGVWKGPHLGLRRQANLFNLARRHLCEPLLPESKKRSDVREAHRLRGSRVKGTGEGQRVKGHIRERRMKAISQERKRAMLDMPRLVEEWKDTGHGRGWKKWPK